VVARAREGARLLTMRGVAMRGVTVACNLALLGLVAPAQLGLLAVVRAAMTIVQFAAELGVDRVLLRRPADPTREEFAALAGLQAVVVAAMLAAGVASPGIYARLVHIDARWGAWLFGSIATMVVIPFGTGARVRLERALRYERLATVDIMNVAIQNVGLVLAALLHRFEVGVFVVFALMNVAVNLLLFAWSPGPRPAFRLARLRAIAGQSAGFMIAQWLGVLREHAVPLLITRLFDIATAGVWAFAIRLSQLLNVTFEGFRAAAVPAAARVAHDRSALRRIAEHTFAGAAVLAGPVMALAFAGLPVVGQVWPQWRSAVPLAQTYVLAYGVAGIADATLEPVAVTLFGAGVAFRQQTAALAGVAAGLAGARLFGWPLTVAALGMALAPTLVVLAYAPRDVRPAAAQPGGALLHPLAVAVAAVGIAAVLRVPPVVPAGLTGGFCTWSIARCVLRARAERTAGLGSRPTELLTTRKSVAAAT
jgi:O-antigen/teichoic acid export membrane protein